jgi:hypothetical protein
VVPLALQLGDDHHREDDLVLGEPAQRAGVGEQDAGVEDVGVNRRLHGALGLGLLGLDRHGDTPHGSARALLARP